ncbi:MAG: hypothetical protein AB8H80_18755 [Planctomycetota bacterium]
MFASFAASLVLASALPSSLGPSPQGSEADPPLGLTIVVCDVGQGDGVVLRAPDGTIHVYDAGEEGEGTATMLPTIQSLQPTGYGFTVLSHFHIDHAGGLDDVLGLPFLTALDRGDVNRPNSGSVTSYLAAAGSRRQSVVVGQTYSLGGGATMTCICANGQIVNGGFVNPANGAQEENARSVAMRIDYGDFSMWLGGDLTGGGNSTANVESLAALGCGDVDVYKLNHHGSNTSTSTDLVARLDPELAVASCGDGNPFGHPTANVVNRLNQAQAVRALLATSEGAANVIGFGVAGAVRIDTDGFRYRATAERTGDFLDFYCDEVVPETIPANTVRISEFHRNPSVVPDTNGEYVEVVNIGAEPVALKGLRLGDNAGVVTLAANYQLVPGRPLVFQLDGNDSRNGGQPLGVALPFGSLQLANAGDFLTVSQGPVLLDSVLWSAAGFPGGSGAAAERVDLFGANTAANFAAATVPFGSGDLGTPGASNTADQTGHPTQLGVDIAPDRVTVHATSLDFGGAIFSVVGLSEANAPAFPFGGAQIPIAADTLFQETLGVGGLLALLPVGGYRSIDIALPQPNPISGTQLYAAHILLDLQLQVPGVSAAVPFVLP